MGGYLSEKEAELLGRSLLAITNAAGSSVFQETVLQEYSSLFGLDYCHLAHMTEKLDINIHLSQGDGEGVFSPYGEHGEHCIFKNDALIYPPAPIPVSIDNSTFTAIAQENPLYDAIRNNVSYLTTIAGVHPDRNGLIGLRYDQRPITDGERIINSILAPNILSLYHLHQKMVRYHDLNSFLINEVTRSHESPFIILDSRFRIILNHNGFSDNLKRFGLTEHDIITTMERYGIDSITRTCEQQDSCCISPGAFPVVLRIEPALINRYYYYKIQPVESTVNIIGKQITRREHEIYEMVKSGLTNRVIAETLSISEETVKRHLSNLYLKTGAPNRTALSQMDFRWN